MGLWWGWKGRRVDGNGKDLSVFGGLSPCRELFPHVCRCQKTRARETNGSTIFPFSFFSTLVLKISSENTEATSIIRLENGAQRQIGHGLHHGPDMLLEADGFDGDSSGDGGGVAPEVVFGLAAI